MYYWDRMNVDFHRRTNLMTLMTFVAPLAAIGLVCGDLENAWDCCVVGNKFMAAPRSSPIAASVTTKINHVTRFVHKCI